MRILRNLKKKKKKALGNENKIYSPSQKKKRKKACGSILFPELNASYKHF